MYDVISSQRRVSLVYCFQGGLLFCVFFFQAEDGIRDYKVTGVQTCALPISGTKPRSVISLAYSDLFLAALASPATAGRNANALQHAYRRIGRELGRPHRADPDRESVVEGKRVDLGGRRII